MKKKMITIDGSFGEGGGQILRSSIGLSLVTGKTFTLENVRAKRKRPGLLRQHLTALNAAVKISGGHVEGNHIGSDRVTFEPGKVTGGSYRFSVGTAGSTTLVLQAILPALLIAPGESRILLEGGTHNPMAPPFDFLQRSFLPLISRMGSGIAAEISSYGFYPAGGGSLEVKIKPAEILKRIDIMERGNDISRRATALYAKIPRDIAESEMEHVKRRLKLEEDFIDVKEVHSPGPGNAVLVEVESENVTYLATSFGEKRVSRERVAGMAVQQVRRYLESGVPVGEYIADQLLIPMAMAGGGGFRTVKPTLHTETNIEVINEFLDVPIRVENESEKSWVIQVGDR